MTVTWAGVLRFFTGRRSHAHECKALRAKSLCYCLYESLPPLPGLYLTTFPKFLLLKSILITFSSFTALADIWTAPPPGPLEPHNPLLLPADGERGRKKIKATRLLGKQTLVLLLGTRLLTLSLTLENTTICWKVVIQEFYPEGQMTELSFVFNSIFIFLLQIHIQKVSLKTVQIHGKITEEEKQEYWEHQFFDIERKRKWSSWSRKVRRSLWWSHERKKAQQKK